MGSIRKPADTDVTDPTADILAVTHVTDDITSPQEVDPRSDAAAAVAPWNQNSSAGWTSGGRPSGYNTPIAVPSQWSR
jgi:hypothetical protein